MAASARLTLFAAHLPGAGIACTGRFLGTTLWIEGPCALRVDAHALRVRRGGFDDDGLFLSWEEGGVTFSAMTAGATDSRALIESAPAALDQALRGWRREVGTQRFKWNAVLAALGALALGVLLLIWQSERVAGWLAGRVSPATERRLGEASLAQLGGKSVPAGAASAAVKQIGGMLTAGSRYSYEWRVADDDDINAFALPGGFVIVNRGLIARTESAEELAGVLAHEVQHIEQRHSLQQMIHSAGWAAFLAVSLGDVSAITAILIHQAGNLRHSRRLEGQADTEGVLALVRAGIHPAGLAEFFERISDELPPDIPLLSSHPASPERIAAIEETVARNPCSHCKRLDIDWKAVHESLRAAAAGEEPAPGPAGAEPD